MFDWFPEIVGVLLVSRNARCLTGFQEDKVFDWLSGRLGVGLVSREARCWTGFQGG